MWLCFHSATPSNEEFIWVRFYTADVAFLLVYRLWFHLENILSEHQKCTLSLNSILTSNISDFQSQDFKTNCKSSEAFHFKWCIQKASFSYFLCYLHPINYYEF